MRIIIHAETLSANRKPDYGVAEETFTIFPPEVSKKEHKRWGLPGSKERLKAIVSHIHKNIALRRNRPEYSDAINDWQYDLEWLDKLSLQ